MGYIFEQLHVHVRSVLKSCVIIDTVGTSKSVCIRRRQIVLGMKKTAHNNEVSILSGRP